MIQALEEINEFLGCATPKEWVEQAVKELDTLLIDHAQCEKKAASAAMSLMYKYVDKLALLRKMGKLAREELVHFDQVLSIMEKREIDYIHLPAGRYAGKLLKHVRTYEPQALIDKLIVGAIVEARSCERFNCLIPVLDDELAKFYHSLLKSEARHYQDYLVLAREYSPEPIDERIAFFIEIEKELILSSDEVFRFHSGTPISSMA